MNMLAKNQTNLLITFIIVIGMAVFFKFIDRKESLENFENEDQNEGNSEPNQNDYMNDDSLLAIQDFTKFAVQGPKGDKGDRGDEGRVGSKGEKGEKGKTGEDFTSLLTTTGKLWLGGFNSGKSGYDKDNEIQLYLGGSQGQGANNGRQGQTSFKLKIDGYDNTNSDVYPLYCMDKGGNTDFYIKNRTSIYNRAKVYINGSLNVVNDIFLERNSYIKSEHLFNLQSKESINLYARDSINIKKMNNVNTPSTGNLKIEGNLTLETDALFKRHITVSGTSFLNGNISTMNDHLNFIKKAKILNVEVGTENGDGITIRHNNRGIINLGPVTKLVGDANGFHIQQKVGSSWETIAEFTGTKAEIKKDVYARQNINVTNNVTAIGNGRFGPAYIGNHNGSINQNGTYAQFSHYNRRSQTQYSLLQQNTGQTFINSNDYVRIRKNNSDTDSKIKTFTTEITNFNSTNITTTQINATNISATANITAGSKLITNFLETYYIRPRIDVAYDHNQFASKHLSATTGVGGSIGDILVVKRFGDNMPGFVSRITSSRVGWRFVWDGHNGGKGTGVFST